MKEFVQSIAPDKLTPFAQHPFQLREDASMDELTESIRVYGVLSPLLARPRGEGYELVSGHRRRAAAIKLGLHFLPRSNCPISRRSSKRICSIPSDRRTPRPRSHRRSA